MSRHNMYRCLAVAGLGLGLGLCNSAANAGTVTGHANAEILPAISISEDTQMNFGKIAVDTSAQNVPISAAGAITCPSQYTCTGTPAAGGFTATGQPSTAVTISFSSGDTLTGAGDPMALGTFVHSAGGSPALGAGGTLAFNVGATLAVGASQAAGSYAGTYTVTVNY